MSPENDAPLHGGRPPKPSIFPLLALAALAGGAFAANARWGTEPRWAAPAEVLAGLAGSVLVFRLGCRLLGSRRAGFLAALALAAAAAALWHAPPFEWGQLFLLLLVPVSLAAGWALDGFRERRFGPVGDLAARALLALFGMSVALLLIAVVLGALGARLVPSGIAWVAAASLAAAGLVAAGMALVGRLDRWPTIEAVLVLAVGLVVWAGRALAIGN